MSIELGYTPSASAILDLDKQIAPNLSVRGFCCYTQHLSC